MRRNIVAGNWKMNLTFQEAKSLTNEILQALNLAEPKQAALILCPPFPYLSEVMQIVSGNSLIAVGAQNCANQVSGAFTGEVSAKMLKSMGLSYVILGHSERRSIYQETDAIVLEKLKITLEQGLQPIFCCGETLQEREAGIHFDVIRRQISSVLVGLSASDFSKVIIAYEPVWAIGTGVTASAAQAQEMHHFIRSILTEQFGNQAAADCTILYGGSCNASNAKELFANPDVDGGLIGGASLKAKDFLQIANSF